VKDDPDKDWRLPVLDRMREDFARVAARDALAAETSTGPPRRTRRLGLAIAAALIAALVVLVVVLQADGDEALADVRDAPTAAARAGSFRFSTTATVREGSSSESDVQSGVVDLPSRSSHIRLFGESSRGLERITIGRDLWFRVVRGSSPEPWQHLTLRATTASALPALAGPVSARAIESLRNAEDVEVVAGDERIGGQEVTHYRLRMSAAQFVAARGASDGSKLADVRGQLDVWLDDDDLPRRIRAGFTDGQETFTIDTTYTDYGADFDIRAPRDAQPAQQGGALTTEDPVVVNLRVVFGE